MPERPDSIDRGKVATIVQAHRGRLGLNQDIFAKKAKISLRTLQKIEAGDDDWSIKSLGSVADALGLTIDTLLATAEDPKFLDAIRESANQLKGVLAQSEALLEKLEQLCIGRTTTQFHGDRPVLVGLPGQFTWKVYGRDSEIDQLLAQLLSASLTPVIPLIAPPGYGKSSVIFGVLQRVTDGKRITREEVHGVICYDCSNGMKVDDLLAPIVDSTAHLGLRKIVGTPGNVPGKLQMLFDCVHQSWFVLQNTEALLDEHGRFKDDEIDALVSRWLDSPPGSPKLVIESRVFPQLRSGKYVGDSDVGVKLLAGLDRGEAVAWIREIGEPCGLRGASDEELLRFADRFHCVPQWIENAVGFLVSRFPAYRLSDLLQDKDLFLKFDSEDLESRERGFRKLLYEHSKTFSDDARRILGFLSFFPFALPQDALEALMSRQDLVRPLNQLVRSRTVQLTEDISGVQRYSVPSGMQGVIKAFNLWLPEPGVALRLVERAVELSDTGQFQLGLEAFTAAATLYSFLFDNGNQEVSFFLVGAVLGVGMTLMGLGRTAEALTYLERLSMADESLSQVEPLLARQIGILIGSRGICLAALDRAKEALDLLDCAARILESRLQALEAPSGQPTEADRDGEEPQKEPDVALESWLTQEKYFLPSDLANVRRHQASALTVLGRPAESEKASLHSIQLYEALCASRPKEIKPVIAEALSEYGLALSALGRLPDSITAHARAVALLEEVIRDGSLGLDAALANALSNQAIAMMIVGRSSEALPLYERCVEFFRRLVDHGQIQLEPRFATALMNHGLCLFRLGRHHHALPSSEESVRILDLQVQKGHVEFKPDLAKALLNHGTVLWAAGMAKESLDAYDRCLLILEPLVEAGRKELALDLGRCLVCKQAVLSTTGRLDDSILLATRATAVFESLVSDGRSELTSELAQALANQAGVLFKDHPDDAVLVCERAVQILEALERSGQNELKAQLGQALVIMGTVYMRKLRLSAALASYDRSIEICEKLVNAGSVELNQVLIRGLMARIWCQLLRGRWRSATADRRRTIKFLKSCIAVGQGHLRAELAVLQGFPFIILALVPARARS